MEESGLNRLILLLERGAKISKKTETDNEILVEIIMGLDGIPPDLEAIPTAIRIPITDEVKEFFSRELVQGAMYNPRERGIVLVDMVGYSLGSTPVQSVFLTVFNCAIDKALRYPNANREDVEQIIPTGDGCYIIFHEKLNDRFFKIVFGLFGNFKVIQKKFNQFSGCPNDENNEIYLRVGCELGETDFFYDLNRQKNCFGVGINEAARILSCGQDYLKTTGNKNDNKDVIFLGEKVLPQAQTVYDHYSKSRPEVSLTDFGVLEDKHQQKRRVWCFRGMSKNLAFFDQNMWAEM